MTKEQATKCWNQIKKQLEYKNCLKLDDLNKEDHKYIETQQIQTILGWGNETNWGRE